MPSLTQQPFKTLASLNLFFGLCGALGVFMLAGTLKPDWDIYHRPWFIALLGALALNTIACVAMRWKSVPWPSLVSHLGILCILGGGAASLALGKNGQIALNAAGPAVSQASAQDGSVALTLPFQLKLKKFEIETYGPARHELVLLKENGENETLWVEPGMRYTAKDGHAKLEVHEFNPDFFIDGETHRVARRSNQPNNPALRVSFTASPRRELWVFQDYPGIHQEGMPIQIGYAYHAPAVKQFKSQVEIQDASGKAISEGELWVNKPLRRDGYTLYQASYDPEDPRISVISVSKDPGTPLVYLGFAILVLGLSWNTFRRMA